MGFLFHMVNIGVIYLLIYYCLHKQRDINYIQGPETQNNSRIKFAVCKFAIWQFKFDLNAHAQCNKCLKPNKMHLHYMLSCIFKKVWVYN